MPRRLPVALYFDQTGLDHLKEKVRSGPPAHMLGLLRSMCDELLQAFCPEDGFDEMEAKRTSNDLACWEPHLGYVRRNADVIQKLGLAFLLTDDGRYADLARRTMLVQARHGEWHQHYRTHGTIECGEVCKGMATGYDWLCDVFSSSEREEIESAMAEKGGRDLAGSLTGTGEGMSPADGERFTANNFGLVMSGGLGLIGLALEGRHPDAAGWVKLATDYMEKSMRGQYGVDGGIVEATRYWNYSTPFCLFLMDPLLRLRGRDLYSLDAFSRTADFPVYLHSTTTEGPRGVINFADTTFREPATHGCVLLKFASHYGRGDYQHMWERWFAEDLWAGSHHDLVHSILWYDPDVAPAPPRLDRIKRFRTLEWVFVRDGWEPQGTLFVLKSGPFLKGHNHRDRNSFVLEAFGERLALDAGSGPYYTDIQRDYYSQSVGHNVLLVNGEGQRTGGAEVVAYSADGVTCYVVSDASAVYPQAEEITREVLAVEGRVYLIRDRVRCAEPPAVDWLLHTFGQVAEDGEALRIEGEKATLWMWVLSPESWSWAVRPGHVDARENVSRTLEVSASPGTRDLDLTVLLVPVRAGAVAPAIRAEAGTLTVTTPAGEYRLQLSADRLEGARAAG